MLVAGLTLVVAPVAAEDEDGARPGIPHLNLTTPRMIRKKGLEGGFEKALRGDLGGVVGQDSWAPAVDSPAPVSGRFGALSGWEYHLSPHGSPVVGPAVQFRQSLQEGAVPRLPLSDAAEPADQT